MANVPNPPAGNNQNNPPPAVNNPVPFALTPNLVNVNDVIDYSTKEGMLLFKTATDPLPVSYDGESRNIILFIEEVKARAQSSGWSNIVSFTVGADTLNIFNDHGRYTMDQLNAHVATYVNTNTRAAQNSMQMYLCLSKSITDEGKAKLANEAASYTINGITSGPLFFKLMVSKAIVDNNSTTSHLKEQLASLDVYMQSVNSNIKEFNIYVKNCKTALLARGERVDDLLISLFKGYKAASDEEFREYIKRRREDYDDGTPMTAEQLMVKAENKYLDKVRNGTWNAESEDHKDLVALKALADRNLKLSAHAKKKKGANTRTNSKQQSKKGTKASARKKKAFGSSKEPWMTVHPKEGEAKSKVVQGVTWYWCDTHQSWVQHKPEECRKKAKEDEHKTSNDGKKKKNKTFATILETIGASSSDSDSSDDE